MSLVDKLKERISSSVLRFKLKMYFLSPKTRVLKGAVGSLALVALLGSGVFLVQYVQRLRTQAAGVSLTLSSNNSNPKVGDTFVIAASIDTKAMSVCGADLEVTYDPNALDIVSWTQDTFLPVVLVPAGGVLKSL